MAAVQREESDEALTTGAEQHVPIALRVSVALSSVVDAQPQQAERTCATCAD